MSETWASANARMACLDCGESGAEPYRYNGNAVRVCRLCAPRWDEFRLVPRERLACEQVHS